MKNSQTPERVARVLTIVTFVMICWVAKRSIESRVSCVSSSFISFVQVEGERFANCNYESRLNPRDFLTPVMPAKQTVLRALEILEPLVVLIPGPRPGLAVEISEHEPDLFELGSGYVRIGAHWLKDRGQLRRALIMGVLRNQFPAAYNNHFQLETMADFLSLAVFGADDWLGDDGKTYSLVRDMRFSTVAPSFEQYCESPFRSLSHKSVCDLERDAQANVWGFRPLLAVSLWRIYDKLSIGEKLNVMKALRSGKSLPEIRSLASANAEGLVEWFNLTLNDHLAALLLEESAASDFALKSTLKELEVESPTHWELTLDLLSTPAWREIFEQMRQRAQYRKERVLIFTPEGAKALPSGLPVAWSADEISSQTHVLIACDWPKPEDTVHVKARHMFARQSCAKLSRPFWD